MWCGIIVFFCFRHTLDGIYVSDSAYCDTCYHSVFFTSVIVLSVTLVHPAKAAGRNEMLFDRNTRVVPSNIVLDRFPVSPGDFGP